MLNYPSLHYYLGQTKIYYIGGYTLNIKKISILISTILIVLSACSSEVNHGSSKESNLIQDGTSSQNNFTVKLKDAFVAPDGVTFNLYKIRQKGYAEGGKLFLVNRNFENKSSFNVSVLENEHWNITEKNIIVPEDLYIKANNKLQSDYVEVKYFLLEDGYYRISLIPEVIEKVELGKTIIQETIYNYNVQVLAIVQKIIFDIDGNPYIENIFETTFKQTNYKDILDLNNLTITSIKSNDGNVYLLSGIESSNPDEKKTFVKFFKEGTILYQKNLNSKAASAKDFDDKLQASIYDNHNSKYKPVYFDSSAKLIYFNQSTLSMSDIYSYDTESFLYDKNGMPLQVNNQHFTSISYKNNGFNVEVVPRSSGKQYVFSQFKLGDGLWKSVGEETIEIEIETAYDSDELVSMDDEYIYVFQKVKYNGEDAINQFIFSY